jgi:hypothetical protein
VEAEQWILLELTYELGIECRDVRNGRKDGDAVCGMGLGFFPIVACFFRSSKVVVAVGQRKELEHDESMWSGDANLSGKGGSIGELAGDRMSVRLRKGD